MDKVYVIKGSTGVARYGDEVIWDVLAYLDEDKAIAHQKLLEDWAKENGCDDSFFDLDDTYKGPNFLECPHDPNLIDHYINITGVSYWIEEVPLA